MQVLTQNQTQDVSGGLQANGCTITIPKNGISAAGYKKINTFMQNLFDNADSMSYQAVGSSIFDLLDQGISSEDLKAYNANIQKAVKVCK